jgi:hypothetical protein
VTFSLLYTILRHLLAVLMLLSRRKALMEVELLVLRHENAVLRRRVSRTRYEPADRLYFAALSRLLPRSRWRQVFPVTPATILRWHRSLMARRWDYTRVCCIKRFDAILTGNLAGGVPRCASRRVLTGPGRACQAELGRSKPQILL